MLVAYPEPKIDMRLDYIGLNPQPVKIGIKIGKRQIHQMVNQKEEK